MNRPFRLPSPSLLLSACLLAPAVLAQPAAVEEPRWVPLEPEPVVAPDSAPRTEWAIRPDPALPPAAAPVEDRPTEPAGAPHVSGGVGASEREELAQVKSQYNLHLLFAVSGSGVYLSDVGVVIQDAAGATLLDAVSRGPFLYARLAPGAYRLTVTSAGHAQTRPISIPAGGALSQAFYWSAEQTPGLH